MMIEALYIGYMKHARIWRKQSKTLLKSYVVRVKGCLIWLWTVKWSVVGFVPKSLFHYVILFARRCCSQNISYGEVIESDIHSRLYLADGGTRKLSQNKSCFFFFHSCTVHLDTIKVFYLPTDVQ
jgi:hypothetical protein